MRYYNEAKTERKIRKKARVFTFITIFILISGIYFTTSGTATELWEEEVKEWFKEDVPEKRNTKEKKKKKDKA